jgi:hypothetical protein
MNRRETWLSHPNTTHEDLADEHLLRGNITDARDALENLRSSKGHFGSFYADLKTRSLPLYDIAFHPTTPQRLTAANDTYGLIAEMIDRELSNKALIRRRRVGRLSELAVIGVMLHDAFDESSVATVIPSTRQEDISKGIDLKITPLATASITDGLPLQVKTILRPVDAENSRKEGIIPIGVNEFDEHAGKPENPDSVARSILRELEGSHTADDRARLAYASKVLFDKIMAPDSASERHEQLRRRLAQGSFLAAGHESQG